MTTFILDVLKDLKEKDANLSNLIFVLPSKRAGLFLRHQLHLVAGKTMFSPSILSIEEFVETLSGLKALSNTELLFEFYTVYLELTPENPDTFEVFSKWAQILLQDFNEIDRYNIPQKQIFSYLEAIQEINHWSLERNKTELVANYLKFWKKLSTYYTKFSEQLQQKKKGYQGLIYREAVNNLEKYIAENPNNQHVFLGFNALNTCEETIIKQLLHHKKATIYWDIDHAFLNHPKYAKHDAALFIKQHKNNWAYFKDHELNWASSYYAQPKIVSVYGIPKNIGQAKQIGSLLKTLQTNNQSLESTAVVLGDENLLIPTLNAIPESVNSLNITMGLPLTAIPLASLFDSLFRMHKSVAKSFYFKDVVNVLSHPFIEPLFYHENTDFATLITETIETQNMVYLTPERLTALAPKVKPVIHMLFRNWDNPNRAIQNCLQLIQAIKAYFKNQKQAHLLSLEYLFRFNELFNELQRLNTHYGHVTDISALYGVYKELLSSQTLDFQGEPLQGLQIMGMLESRVLDFETVIIASVNEGVLPSGKSNNSFIPFDIKLENKLPTYKEKDAVYTYHFYRLLQRAKNVFILYNTEADVLTAGEKSRFITQMEIEGIHKISHKIIVPKTPKTEPTLINVNKNENLINRLIQVAEKGFSPSSLTTYIRNPIDFYYQKVLNIKSYDEVEETVAANTLGTVVHNTLEDFYKPLEGKILSADIIKNLEKEIDKTVSHHFKELYKEGDITKGKNLIIYEIAKRYVSNFLNLELKDIDAGNEIKILAIEANKTVSLVVPELGFPIKLTGKVDRVDQYNGTTRIIDYKTGRVDQSQVELVNWGNVTQDYTKYSKSFQILMYVYMMHNSGDTTLPVEAGIISFKNLSSGVLKFTKKDKAGPGAKKNTLITEETLTHFIVELKQLIIEICNIDIPFTEKEI
ncbi:MAG: PD-(D/E)XK nuclease family protein [Flavobacteriaceae bacterium]